MEKIESFIKSSRWKVYFFLNKDDDDNYIGNNLGFKTWKTPAQ